MDKPIDTMTVKPMGEDYMLDAFLSLANHLYSNDITRTVFKRDTGMDIESIVKAKGLNRMIDEQTGYQKAVLSKWLDWVAINHWGIEE